MLRWNDETSAAPMLSSESFPQLMVDVCTAQVAIMTKGGAQAACGTNNTKKCFERLLEPVRPLRERSIV